MSVSAPPGGGPMGPGYAVAIVGAAGPTSLTDLCLVTVEDLDGNGLAAGDAYFGGGTFALVTIAVYVGGTAGPVGLVTAVSPGSPAQLRVQHYNASAALVEEIIATGFTWDPTGGVWALVQRLLALTSSSDMTAVLAAVRKTFP